MEFLEDTSRLNLKGPATLPYIRELLTAVLNAIEGAQHLVIDCSEVTEVDLSCLQLLCSAHRTAAAAGKALTLAGVEESPLRGVSFEAGFQREGACSRNTSDENCLWQFNSSSRETHNA